jgi:YD repeat-containing protein
MRTTRRALFVLAAVVLLVGVMPALAQEPSIAQGQLVRVDANAKTIAIRTPQGTQMQFSYTDDTKVTGADESVAGLATMAGADLTVHYTKKQQDNVATQIEVRKKQ